MSKFYTFPNPKTAPDFAPLASGGDLSAECLLSAYTQGIFPWFCETEPILWWSPNPRAILEPNCVRVQKSIKPYLKRYEVKFDQNFARFITLCKQTRQNSDDGTWISDEIVEAYVNLANLGVAHSVEVYEEGVLIGGLYGLILGKVFCGESMLSLKTGASKVALITLCRVLEKFDFLIDCQIMNEHLRFMGAQDMPRGEFLAKFQILQNLPSGFEKFKDLEKLI
ncbi:MULTISPECIES: leucyl/phenylalanyl-tRNA--protein transferase [unclassified Campylobacter]|uniref:leucyl/phenylalanyl-tRNA--protein transferase n=1 Tax=unclassified Campylobacter TaxID=2593542 RepID=UPI0022E9AE2D|nr:MULTISPECIES: leucyl/phenylalanyl-tRNA--protein transferase [unclassified Campylobacter]MDA3069605.1 leucyl/phenylalanyl-tRNA--protein transferase [Campylobacter sp. VBCF_08 NA3]WBR55059.1 leucyl/phenylalanyl-tRNA--protein transferase [Campylobacter sp. VBCF_01 NA2]